MGNLAEELLHFTPETHHLRWLCDHLDGWQFGDQGLIAAIVDALQSGGIAIEYGAGDGTTLPLTISRLYDKYYECWLAEIDAARRNSLSKIYENANVTKAINWSSIIAHETPVAVCVIDIDGSDSVVMREMFAVGVRPELLVVEHMDRYYPIGTTRPDPVPQWMLGLKLESGHAIQDTAETLQAFAAKYGYERIGVNRCNSYFVRGDKFLHLLR